MREEAAVDSRRRLKGPPGNGNVARNGVPRAHGVSTEAGLDPRRKPPAKSSPDDVTVLADRADRGVPRRAAIASHPCGVRQAVRGGFARLRATLRWHDRC